MSALASEPMPGEPWLRTFAPFQDLKSTAMCKEVSAYVLTVHKSASAKGTSINCSRTPPVST